MIEEWRDVRGYENFYQVSNFGRVRSLSRWIRNKHGHRMMPSKILTPGTGNSGYYFVNLCVDQKSCCKDIHRLTALHFLGFDKSHLTVNHKDGDKLNNHIYNLEFVTQAENNWHKIRVLGKIGHADMRGSKNPMYGKKHSDETKQKIRQKALSRNK